MSDFTFLKGNIETIILCSLQNGNKYGWEIAKEIKERTDGQYEIKQPTLYAYLKRLESNEQITSYWGTESNGGRRRYYSLTQNGREQCEQFASEWKYHQNVLNNLIDDDLVEKEAKPIAQEEVTPLFGSKVKARKSREIVSGDDLDEIEMKLRLLSNDAPAQDIDGGDNTQTHEKAPSYISEDAAHIQDKADINLTSVESTSETTDSLSVFTPAAISPTKDLASQQDAEAFMHDF